MKLTTDEKKLLDLSLHHLEKLVAFDTRNPPRKIDQGGIFAYLVEQFSQSGFSYDLKDHGAGSISLLVRRGAPKILFNVHLDTVPDAPGWTHSPFELKIIEDRAIGLGAADIKGAAAGLLAAAQSQPGALAVLFSSDEEANDARGIAAFLATKHGFDDVVVSEPTNTHAVLAHRGIVSGVANFVGRAGHASEARALTDNAIHRAADWITQVCADVRIQSEDRFAELQGFRFNIGTINGGIKGNMIAPSCEVKFNARPLPSQTPESVAQRLKDVSTSDGLNELKLSFTGACLPAQAGEAAIEALQQAELLAQHLQFPVGAAVDFWTEAALFSAAGMNAIVFGPGSIEQAHAADEFVLLQQLHDATQHYARIIRNGLV